MTDVSLLQLRRQLTVDEATHLLAASSGHDTGKLSDLLLEAIESGDLPARIERWEVVDYENGNYLGAINPMATAVQRTDLDVWCQRLGLATISKVATAGETSATSSVTADMTRAKAKKARQNFLDAPIDRAIKTAGSDVAAAVFLALKNMALEGKDPFTGEISKAGGLYYTNEGNALDELTLERLSSRLSRRRKAARLSGRGG